MIRLLEDWLAEHYDPARVAWHFLDRSEGWSISEDFEVYAGMTEALASAIDYAPQPNLTGGFWVKKVVEGQLACIAGARRYMLHRTLAEEIPRMMPGATCTADSARYLTGNIAFTGGLWVSEKFRGQGLAVEACGVVNACAVMQWDPDYFVAVTEQRLAEMARRQGFARVEALVEWQRWKMDLCWSDRPQALRALAAAMRPGP